LKVIVTIDTEEEWDWAAGFPIHSWSVRNIGELERFHVLCMQHSIRPTYFTNYAVLENDTSAMVMKKLADGGECEIGMHCHPWSTPPHCREDNTGPTSFLENLPPRIASEKLKAVYESHLERGFKPRSFRGGRYSSGTVTQQFLTEHHFLVDASICPYTCWSELGAPDYRTKNEQPKKHCCARGEGGLWQIPLTRVMSRQPFHWWNRLLTTIETTPLSRLRLIGILQSTGIIRRIWLNFETETPANMLWLLRNAARLRLPYLCFTVHSSSLSVGPSPYARNQAQVNAIYAGIEQIFQFVQSNSAFQPVTISQLATDLEREI
jgi:hypothetical protein